MRGYVLAASIVAITATPAMAADNLSNAICIALCAEKTPQIPSARISQIDVDKAVRKDARFPYGFRPLRITVTIANVSFVEVFNCVWSPEVGTVASLDHVE